MPHCIGGRYEKPRQKLNIRSTSYLPCFEFVFNSYSPCFLWPDPLFFFLFFFLDLNPLPDPPKQKWWNKTELLCCISLCIVLCNSGSFAKRRGNYQQEKTSSRKHANSVVFLLQLQRNKNLWSFIFIFFFSCLPLCPLSPIRPHPTTVSPNWRTFFLTDLLSLGWKAHTGIEGNSSVDFDIQTML